MLGNRKGVAMIEYALLVALIAVILATAIKPVREQIETVFDNVRIALGGE